MLFLLVFLLARHPAVAQFTDVSSAAGITLVHNHTANGPDFNIGTGAAWFDYDNDGDLDLYVTTRQGANVLYENDGAGFFTDVAVAVGADDAAHDGAGVAVADFDNDGDLDLFLANSLEDALLRNELVETGTATFTDITASAGITGDERGTSASWGDYDGDGFLDLYVAHHEPMSISAGKTQDHLYHNNGDGTFTNVSYLLAGDADGSGTDDAKGYGFITAWTDFDDDGDLDLYLMNDCPFYPEGNKLWRNDGGLDPENWLFTEVSAEVGADQCANAMGIAVGDYNRDGRWDYYFTNIGSAYLLRNDGGLLTDVTTEAGVFEELEPGTGKVRVTWGAIFFDYDLDMWQDLVVAAGVISKSSETDPQPNMLYHNDGNETTLTNVSTGSGIEDERRTRTIVMGDYDNDGDPDLFYVNYAEPVVLVRNDTDNGNHWLILDLEGVVSNRDGVGARIRVRTPDGVDQYWEMRSGSSLGGGDDLAAYFGLGANASVDEIEIRWPSGIVQTLTGVAADQRMTVVESGLRVVMIPQAVPLEIPPGGGSFAYTLVLENHSDVTRTFDVWVNLTGPGGVNITRGPVPVTLDPGATTNKDLSQTVPASADAGTYTMTGSAGAFPIAEQSDAFTFTKAEVVTTRSEGAWTSSFETAFGGTPDARTPAPSTPALDPNFPNPFNPATRIPFNLPEAMRIRLAVYDALGREVAVLVDEERAAGRHVVTWDAAGQPTGSYFLRLEAGGNTFVRAMLLMK
ncbi:FG-GAP-like repeat-containing protein [Rhodocaloribacter sp.]